LRKKFLLNLSIYLLKSILHYKILVKNSILIYIEDLILKVSAPGKLVENVEKSHKLGEDLINKL